MSMAHLSPQPRGSFFNTPSISMTSQASTIVSGKSEEWFSLEGYLSLKWQGGELTMAVLKNKINKTDKKVRI